jgi:hypothetical protein
LQEAHYSKDIRECTQKIKKLTARGKLCCRARFFKDCALPVFKHLNILALTLTNHLLPVTCLHPMARALAAQLQQWFVTVVKPASPVMHADKMPDLEQWLSGRIFAQSSLAIVGDLIKIRINECQIQS